MPVIVGLVLRHGCKRCLTLVDVIQTLMRFEDWSCVSLRYEVQYYECKSSADLRTQAAVCAIIGVVERERWQSLLDIER